MSADDILNAPITTSIITPSSATPLSRLEEIIENDELTKFPVLSRYEKDLLYYILSNKKLQSAKINTDAGGLISTHACRDDLELPCMENGDYRLSNTLLNAVIVYIIKADGRVILE